jgi:hypothetical protein
MKRFYSIKMLQYLTVPISNVAVSKKEINFKLSNNKFNWQWVETECRLSPSSSGIRLISVGAPYSNYYHLNLLPQLEIDFLLLNRTFEIGTGDIVVFLCCETAFSSELYAIENVSRN